MGTRYEDLVRRLKLTKARLLQEVGLLKSLLEDYRYLGSLGVTDTDDAMRAILHRLTVQGRKLKLLEATLLRLNADTLEAEANGTMHLPLVPDHLPEVL